MTPRQWLTLVLVLVLLATALLVIRTGVSSVIPYSATENRLYRLTNQSRINHGLPPLRKALVGLHTFARHTADRLARARRLTHSMSRPCAYWGENIGSTATGLAAVELAFMRSQDHRTNILNPNFTRVGVGAKLRSGVWWVAVEFCR